ncbi:MAG: hypothetical protein OJI67_05155, partial [Prosthecobacter sp.]|nr:hypothetical protein [Prosthecobacter sp.]
MFKVSRFIALPFLVGLSIGLVAAIAAILGARLLMLGLSSKQETIGFIGFIAQGCRTRMSLDDFHGRLP